MAALLSPTLPSSPIAAPSRPSASGSARNPISLRLYKVLASSFDDPSSREALETVSDFYASGSSTTSASANGDRGVGEGAAARARRGLRRDGEEKLAEGSRKFLAAFGDVDKVRRARRDLGPWLTFL